MLLQTARHYSTLKDNKHFEDKNNDYMYYLGEQIANDSSKFGLIQYIWGPQGFWGSGENGFLFSGSWGALVIILGELGIKLIIWGI